MSHTFSSTISSHSWSRDEKERKPLSPESDSFSSHLQSKYRNASDTAETFTLPDRPISCAECHNYVTEMIRIHQLLQASKKELKESRHAHESLLKEYKEEVNKTAKQHQRIVDGFRDEIEALRVELKLKGDQLVVLRQECSNLSKSCSELNGQLTITHDKYVEQVSQNSVMTIRIRELEQALQQSRMEKEVAVQQNLQQIADELRSVQREKESLSEELENRNREIRRRDELLEQQNAEIRKFKSLERQQLEVLESQSADRARLHAAVRQQSSELDDVQGERDRLSRQLKEAELVQEEQAAEISKLRLQLRQMKELEETVEAQALAEFRKSKRNIEQKLEKLQSECAQVASLLTPSKSNAGASSRGVGTPSRHDASSLGLLSSMPDWLPSGVSRLVDDFRHSLVESGGSALLGGSLGSHLSSFLIALNKIWRDRLEDKIRLLRHQHLEELRELKRRLAQRIPYEQVVQKARIVRLQKDLDATRAAHLKTKGDQAKGLLDLSLATVENLSRQIMEYERENHLLQQQIKICLEDKDKVISTQQVQEQVEQLIQDIQGQINTLADKLWGAANTFLEKAGNMIEAPERKLMLNRECQLYLDGLEIDIRECKSGIRSSASAVTELRSDIGFGRSRSRSKSKSRAKSGSRSRSPRE